MEKGSTRYDRAPRVADPVALVCSRDASHGGRNRLGNQMTALRILGESLILWAACLGLVAMLILAAAVFGAIE
jgi:hypothetical protein